MKITKTLVKQFELEQKGYGTKVAIHNLIFEISAQLLKEIGILHIKVSSRIKKERR